MQVILPDEQIHQIQLLLSNLIQKEIKHQLEQNGLNCPYLNKQQTCDYLGISNNTLDSWIQRGLPSIKIGKTIRFHKDTIDSWLNSNN
ncbi:helix-turn-helix domain-containing protein [Streptococcus anginosus]|uniref:helix-turn-helix domain-containing protein n=1 Tax=Streptococcus anginosus TaxID=1328 RepID=UPI00066A5137|nr:helix-turn-helix domain-containing protein [Streptococcus anginosus]MCW0997163.1 helix-turn-helix domain-containing protein [Streptococcus anginosus]